jgi:major type 1 subunit fimbrin (pilin)
VLRLLTAGFGVRIEYFCIARGLKMKKIGSICLLLAVSSVASVQAFASTGTIDFGGEVTAQTCFASINGSTASDSAASATIRLPSVGAGLLKSAGDTAGTSRFIIKVSADGSGATPCAATVGGSAATDVYAFIEAGPENNLQGRLINTAASGAAANVDLRLLNSAGTPIVAGATGASPWLAQNSTIENMANALNTGLVHYVQYYATGAATAGAVQGRAVFSLAYR